MAKKSGKSNKVGTINTMVGKVKVVKAPARNVKGIGKLGTFEGGLRPGVIDPKYGTRNGLIIGNLIGPEGR
jgi:hypothetical protein